MRMAQLSCATDAVCGIPTLGVRAWLCSAFRAERPCVGIARVDVVDVHRANVAEIRLAKGVVAGISNRDRDTLFGRVIRPHPARAHWATPDRASLPIVAKRDVDTLGPGRPSCIRELAFSLASAIHMTASHEVLPNLQGWNEPYRRRDCQDDQDERRKRDRERCWRAVALTSAFRGIWTQLRSWFDRDWSCALWACRGRIADLRSTVRAIDQSHVAIPL